MLNRSWGGWGLILASVACGSSIVVGDEEHGTAAGGGGGTDPSSTAATTSSGGPGGGVSSSSSTGTGGPPGIADCVDVEPVFELPGLRPADIILVVDNSGSMVQELQSIELNININFAQIMGMSGVDYQLIVLSDHGSSNRELCVGSPLSNAPNCDGVPGDVPGQFHHYDVEVESFDSLCVALDTLRGSNGGGEPDEQALHPEGWIKWLRPEAIKVFIEVTDDGADCYWQGHHLHGRNDNNPTSSSGSAAQSALLFDSLLRAEAPSQFGAFNEREYLFYSIVGLEEKTLTPYEPYLPGEPMVGATTNDHCGSAQRPGWTYQWLSRGTDALRFPMCQYGSYDAVFQAIAAGVVEEVNAACTYAMSAPAEIDPNSLDVVYRPGDAMAPPVAFSPVSSEAACGTNDGAYFLSGDHVVMCPATCQRLRDDADHSIEIGGDCL